jgi:hypothetical protein
MSFIKQSKKAYSQVKENHIAIAMGNMLDDEGSMILNQLQELERGIEMLRTYVGKDYEKQLPAWVQSKVTLATDYISTVGNYLSSKNEKVTEETIKESSDLTESTFEKIYQMQQDGKSVEDIAKELNLKADLVKKVLGEQVELKEFNDAQIALLKKEFDPLKNKQISTARANQLSNILDKLDDGTLQKLRDALIPFVSAVSAAKLTTRKFKGVKITNVKVPGLEGMAEESSYWWHDGKSGYVKASDSDKDLVAWLKKNGYKPEKKEMAEENEYVAVHVKKGKTSVTANSSYEAAKKASEKFGLNGTTGITVMLAKKDGEDVIHKATEEVELDEIANTPNWALASKPEELSRVIRRAEKAWSEADKRKDSQAKQYWTRVKNNAISKYNKAMKGRLKKTIEEVELKPVPSLEDSAKKHNVDIETLKKQLEKGIEIEKEHTKDEKVAEKIALAHIDERPDYYVQIDKLEKKPVEKVAEVKEPTGDLKDACWTGYVAIGTKMKNGKRVPNCVPKSEAYKGARAIVENAFKKLKEKK